MRRSQLWFFFFLLCSNLIWAQEVERLLETTETIGPFKNFKWSTPSEMKAGDVLTLSMDEIDGKRLSKIEIKAAGELFTHLGKKLQFIERKTFTATRDGYFDFTFINNSVGKRTIRLQVESIKPNIYDSDRLLQDVKISNNWIDSIEVSYLDTIFWPDLYEEETRLDPTRDFEGASFACMSDTFLGVDNQFAVYWVGIGTEALREYEDLKNNPPPTWILESINEPVFAYGLGLTGRLPRNESSLASNVVLQVQNPDTTNYEGEDPQKFDRKTIQSWSYGFINDKRAAKHNGVRICMKNTNTTTDVPVYIKVAKFRIVRRTKWKYVSRQRVQEIFLDYKKKRELEE